MEPFMDQDFLLSTPTARTLYHEAAEPLPIVDYHCHIPPQDIAEDRRFDTLTEAWLGGDHYKWRQLRLCGVPEAYITGDASPWEKFEQWAQIMPRLVGNPLYHWSHLELQRYFGFTAPLGPGTARAAWEHCNEQLRGMSARQLILRSAVKALCTTDDPADSLAWHQALRDEGGFPVLVLPAFRPDKALSPGAPGFPAYLERLGGAAGVEINSLERLKEALSARMDRFAALGCLAADHAPASAAYLETGAAAAEAILQKALTGGALTAEEAIRWQSHLLVFLGRAYSRRGWVMQLHYGAMRDNNTRMFSALGPDTGFDAIRNEPVGPGLAALLDALDRDGALPKTVVYSLNPTDNAAIASILGCFAGAGIRTKVQHGAAWWFNDSRAGMEAHLTNLASLGCLGNFIGMLTDSRSLLSYPRHEYFRRILCRVLGRWTEAGEYPADLTALKGLTADISYHNAVSYFGFPL